MGTAFEVASLPSDGQLSVLLSRLSDQLKLSDQEVNNTRLYFESRHCSTLRSLAEMNTLQWAHAQRSAEMTPQLLAGLVQEIEQCYSKRGSSTLRARCSALKYSMLAIGSWMLLCILDLSGAWPSGSSHTVGLAERQSLWNNDRVEAISKVIGILALSVSVLTMSVALMPRCHRPHSNTQGISNAMVAPDDGCRARSPMEEVRLEHTLWPSAIHVILISGGLIWLVFHALGHREPQVLVGLATLYSMGSLSAVDFASVGQRYSPCSRRNDGGAFEPTAPPVKVVLNSTSLTTAPQNGGELAPAASEVVKEEPKHNYVFVHTHDHRWKNLFHNDFNDKSLSLVPAGLKLSSFSPEEAVWSPPSPSSSCSIDQLVRTHSITPTASITSVNFRSQASGASQRSSEASGSVGRKGSPHGSQTSHRSHDCGTVAEHLETNPVGHQPSAGLGSFSSVEDVTRNELNPKSQ